MILRRLALNEQNQNTMAKKPLRIGLIGYGFMGRTHSNAFTQVKNFFDLDYQPVLQAVCARDAEKAKAFAAQWGYASIETDWRKLVERDDIDVIDIAAPNNVHAEIAIAAAKAGKAILCEKPLAITGPDAEKMVKAVAKAKVPNMVWYNYRRIPAVTLAKQLIEEGRLGKSFPVSREVPPRLDHQRRPPAGRRGPLAPRREGRRLWRHGRFARALH